MRDERHGTETGLVIERGAIRDGSGALACRGEVVLSGRKPKASSRKEEEVMKRFHETVSRLGRGEKGQGMTEYIIIVAIIAIGAIIIVGLFGDAIRDRFNIAMEALMGKATPTVTADTEGADQVKKKWTPEADWGKTQ